MKQMICTVAGLFGSTIAAVFGGWDSGLATLVIFMIADYITGLIVAGEHKNRHRSAGKPCRMERAVSKMHDALVCTYCVSIRYTDRKALYQGRGNYCIYN